MARAVMNGESTDPSIWLAMFPTLFGPEVVDADRRRAEALLSASLEVAERGEQVRSQFRGAIVEALTARLLSRRAASEAIRRERMEAVATALHGRPIDPAAAAAIEGAIAEVGRIGDPHRAIDWLSTYPQIVLVALGERP